MLCQECSKKETCQELCPEAESFVSRDYVSQRELTFPSISENNLNLFIDNLNYYNKLFSYQELSSCFKEPEVNFPFLSDLQNKCLHLFYFEGKTYKQIASTLSSANQHGVYLKLSSKQVDRCLYSAKRAIRGKMFYIEGAI